MAVRPAEIIFEFLFLYVCVHADNATPPSLASHVSIMSLFSVKSIAAWLPCSEAYSPIDAFCSDVNLAYFPLGLLLPCDTFLTASLASLIAAGLMCADRGSLGSGRVPEG